MRPIFYCLATIAPKQDVGSFLTAEAEGFDTSVVKGVRFMFFLLSGSDCSKQDVVIDFCS